MIASLAAEPRRPAGDRRVAPRCLASAPGGRAVGAQEGLPPRSPAIGRSPSPRGIPSPPASLIPSTRSTASRAPTMDTFDSHRSTVPARLPAPRPGVPASPDVGRAAGGDAAVAAVGPGRPPGGPPLLVAGPDALGRRLGRRSARSIYLKVKPSYRAISLLRVDPDVTRPLRRPDQRRAARPVPPDAGPADHQPQRPDRRRDQPQGGRPAQDPDRRRRRAGAPKSITVGVIPGTYLIEVSMTSRSPTRPPRWSTPWSTPSSRPTTSGPTA